MSNEMDAWPPWRKPTKDQQLLAAILREIQLLRGGMPKLATQAQGAQIMAMIDEVREALAALRAEVVEVAAHVNAQSDKIDQLIAQGGATPEQLAEIRDALRADAGSLDAVVNENPIPGGEVPPPPPVEG